MDQNDNDNEIVIKGITKEQEHSFLLFLAIMWEEVPELNLSIPQLVHWAQHRWQTLSDEEKQFLYAESHFIQNTTHESFMEEYKAKKCNTIFTTTNTLAHNYDLSFLEGYAFITADELEDSSDSD